MYFEIEIYQIDENHCVFDLVTLNPVVAQIQLPSPGPSHNIQVGTKRPRVMILPLCESTSRVRAHLRQLTHHHHHHYNHLQVGLVDCPTQPTRAGWFEGDYDMN